MLKKIIKVGNSLAVTLPAQFVKETNLKAGSELYIETNSENKTMLLRDKKAKYQVNLSPEFFSWLNEVSKDYADVIKELASK
ncbi:MAG: AbrB/MazE/SpoVT family DNA-binding domain-containing protein [Patescibacteria group bacterium]